MQPQARQTYRTLNQSWAKPETAVRVKGGDGFVIADIPLSFLEASNSNTWDYAIHVVRLCVEQHGEVVSEDGQRVTGQGVPAAGRYLFVTGACTNLHKRQHWLARDSSTLLRPFIESAFTYDGEFYFKLNLPGAAAYGGTESFTCNPTTKD